jgi:DNA polymerase-3 subunit beta
MRLVMEVGHLAKALNLVKGCVRDKTTIPVIQCVHLEAVGNTVKLTGTNLKQEMSVTVPAAVEVPGAVCIPNKVLSGLVGSLYSGAQISLDLQDNGRIRVASGTAKFTLVTLPPQDFPSIATLEEGALSFAMPASDLDTVLSLPLYAASKDEEGSPALYGVNLHVDKGRLAGVAADRFRLSRTSVPLPKGAGGLNRLTLPREAVSELCRILPAAGDVQVAVGSVLQVSTEAMTFTTALMDYAYTGDRGLEQYMQRAKGITATVHPVVLKDALSRVTVVYASGIQKQEGAVVEMAESGLLLSAGQGEYDRAEEQVDAAVEVPGVKFKVSYRFLKEMLAGWPEDSEVEMRFVDTGLPILFTSQKNPHVLHSIGPMAGGH